jgi:hypothetical protein
MDVIVETIQQVGLFKMSKQTGFIVESVKNLELLFKRKMLLGEPGPLFPIEMFDIPYHTTKIRKTDPLIKTGQAERATRQEK